MLKRKRSVKQLIRQHIKGINNCLTEAYLLSLSSYALLCNCHPLYRRAFAVRLRDINAITDAELSNF